jgi:hypothetical protein
MKLAFLSALIPAILTTVAAAQPTAFTYQGRLKNGAQPAAGLHDFRFTLFNVASGGVQLAPPQCVDNILVTEGLFTATIDFGQQFVTTETRFLQIEVRADTGLTCANPAGLVPLAPRQPLTAAPIASHAKTAFSLAAADGSPANAVIVDNDGNVGIGTTNPQALLHVNGSLLWGGATTNLAYSGEDASGLFLEQKGNSSATSKIRLQTSKSGDLNNYSQFFVDPIAGFSFTTLGTGSGNVGIGTESPRAGAKLDVRGNIRLGAQGEFYAMKSFSDDRILHGRVSATGGIAGGGGFLVTHTAGTGVYMVTFNPSPFSAEPTPIATPQSASRLVRVSGQSSSHATFIVTDLSGAQLEGAFTFFAIGP